MVCKLESNNPEQLLRFWKKGKTIYESLFLFTDESLRKEFNKSNVEFRNQSIEPQEEQSDAAKQLNAGFDALRKTLNNYQSVQSATDKLKWNLLSKLLSEQLIGLGFEAPLKSSSQPNVIPIHVWPDKISEFNWNKSSFLSNGVEFLKIRLIDSADINKQRNNSNRKEKTIPPEIKVQDKKVGRPSIKEAIIEAYELLKSKNKIKYSASLKSHVKLIQQTVRNLHPEIIGNKGMQYEAIRRTLNQRFKADGENL